ncbi:membrane protein [Cronobacter phage CR8]|uniref:Uncharacterized protein n=2 Tax=Certrevirus TaxID=1914850 RepID=A0A060ACI9_9CAUD|nr:membrane protein [Cronobacter phage CR8]YP_009189080.1 membrane protein [Cronobacter phage PBES 02]AIA64635.1 hypothetical protein CR8_105 [Cronobacter phage CR8]AKY04119.1 hypothetical protein ADU18_0222 [Cronobacter phage PBES 02]UTC25301.1 hypothetical protein P7_111 [Pectobacterium phage vB_PcaM_P7_Pc]
MEAVIAFFTAEPAGALITLLTFGLIGVLWLFCAEVYCIYERVRALFNKGLRQGYTWKTVAWMPIRIYVVILIPQIVYILFTEIIKFG